MPKVKTFEKFKEEMSIIHPTIEVLSIVYINNSTPVQCKCKTCGHVWEARPGNLINGKYGCPKCGIERAREKRLGSVDTFIKKSKAVHGTKYDYSQVEYSGVDTKVTIICPKHGAFEQTPYNHMKGHGCPKCAVEEVHLQQIKTTEQFILDSKKKFGDRFDYSKVDYKGAFTPVTLICKKHGEFQIKPYAHLTSFRGCPKCSKTNGEQKVEAWLMQQNLNYKVQVYHKIGTLPIKVDFEVYIQDKTFVIEYNGKQHYCPVERFGGEEKFKKQCARDESLRKYCEENNIPLLEIPYSWKLEEMHQALNDFLK